MSVGTSDVHAMGSIRGTDDGTGSQLVGGGTSMIVQTPAHGEFKTRHRVKNHVPLVESTKTDLHRAVDNSDPATLTELLATPLKDQIDHQNHMGFTALHLSAMTSSVGLQYGAADPDRIMCCKLLIEAGANVNIPGQWGQTALQIASISLYPAVQVCMYLVDARADLLAVDDWGCTCLHSCAYLAHPDQLKVLMTHPDFEAAKPIVNHEKQTALQVAIQGYETQQKKAELAPCFCEVRILLETGQGLPDQGQSTWQRTDAAMAKAKH